jgi:hypothetical protein
VPVEVVFVLGRWDQADFAVHPAVVERVDVLGDGDLQIVDAFPGPLVADQFGLEQRVERLVDPELTRDARLRSVVD